MYSKGSNEIKQWMQNIEKMNRKINENKEDEEETSSSPFDILERVREICNRNLKNPENNDEIEQLLVKIADEVKEYISSEKEKETPEEKQPNQNTQFPTDTTGNTAFNQDLGAPGSDTSTAAGVGNNSPFTIGDEV